jgi:hypothetical protein
MGLIYLTQPTFVSDSRKAAAMKKPGWWTGSWLVKTVLIWLCGFLIWLPLFPRSPRLASIILLISMIPLLVLYGGGVIGGWLKLILLLYAAIKGSVSRVKRKHASRLP